MRIGICEWVLPIKGPAVFDKVRSLGIEGIQLDDWAGYMHGRPMTNSYVQDLYRNGAAASGLSLVGMGGNELGKEGGLICAPESEAGRTCWETYQAELDACVAMGLPVHLAPAFFAGFPRTVEDQRHILMNLQRACDYVEGSSVTVSLEGPYSADQILQIWKAVDRACFGIYYDIQNTISFVGPDVPSDIKKIGPGKIVQVHMKDGPPCRHGGLQLGEGKVDVSGCMEALKSIGYDGWLVLENSYCRPYFESDYRDPWDRMAKDVEVIGRYI